MSDPNILNWRRLDDRITTSGQPDEAGLAAIRDLGVGHVVNLALHTHPKALPDEGASVAALGMTYTHIPVDFDNPTEDDFDRFCAVMAAAADVPVHVHCIVNARVTAFVYRWQRDVVGAGEGEARTMMDSVWHPGGVWAEFIGDEAGVTQASAFAGRDY
ncbi:protein tyrosine phosphatase family protein [Polymorphobacter megasporae]|uniref:protein tyrosine phosphatase family protein n=1 Tax=Glacieibacterium megasporae TaxID=2835787 RepID=UPI001C1E3B42|nr:protein tyrosine phosphatase family protein [Polymorphobacter megasporae]UAJ11969.1 protein tyrosine phosphatase family protein [Polymorphobacter megasporae]